MCGQSNCCSGVPRLIFACSGAADVGEIADRAARKMTQNGLGTMFCLAGIGGRVEGIMNKTQAVSEILAIDGCDLDCVKNCLENAGFNKFQHVRVTNLGMEKGKTPSTEKNIEKVVTNCTGMLS